MTKVTKIILLLATVGTIHAQELPQLNGYMFNQFIYNPASGGMYDTDFNASFAFRYQWAGTKGAPLSGFFWADHRFRKNSMSIGVLASYDSWGANRNNDLALNYSYILRLTNKIKLSFGLRVGIGSYQFNVTDLTVYDTGDNLLLANSATYPKIGGGAQLYGRKFYIGIGFPDLGGFNSNKSVSDAGKPFFQKARNFSLLAGYKLKLSDGLGLYPNIKVHYFGNNQNPLRVDASVLLEITDYFWAGVNYGIINQNTALMAGTFISSKFRFMYAFEFFLKSRATSGGAFNVHEINLMLQLDDLFAKKNKVVVE